MSVVNLPYQGYMGYINGLGQIIPPSRPAVAGFWFGQSPHPPSGISSYTITTEDKNLEPVEEIIDEVCPHECSCDTMLLMRAGCQCGGK